MNENSNMNLKGTVPGLEQRKLDIFTGKWKTEGTVYESEFGPAGKITGTDTYEWLPGGFFLVHHVNVNMYGSNSRAIEIIGYDPEKRSYSMHSFDSQGNHMCMRAFADGNTWIFSGDNIRFTGSFSDDNRVITGIWEYVDEKSNWCRWMDIKLTKII